MAKIMLDCMISIREARGRKTEMKSREVKNRGGRRVHGKYSARHARRATFDFTLSTSNSSSLHHLLVVLSLRHSLKISL